MPLCISLLTATIAANVRSCHATECSDDPGRLAAAGWNCSSAMAAVGSDCGFDLGSSGLPGFDLDGELLNARKTLFGFYLSWIRDRPPGGKSDVPESAIGSNVLKINHPASIKINNHKITR